MNKSTLRTCIPLSPKVLPVYLSEDNSAWWYSGSSLMVNLRAVITDYPHMETNLENIYSPSGTSLIPNYSFELPLNGSGSMPSDWSGIWYDWRGVDKTLISETYPYGFNWYWSPRITTSSTIPWKVAYSQSVLTKSDLNNLSRHYITSGSFQINDGEEVIAAIRFMSDNGYCQSDSKSNLSGAYFPQPPTTENEYLITLGNVNVTIGMPTEGESYWEDGFYTLEADYGAVIIYGSSYKVIGFGRGKTTDELDNTVKTNPIWKTYTTSFTPDITGSACMYIYSRNVKTPAIYSNYVRPWVFADYAIANSGSPYISQTIGSAEDPINMDSYSYIEADSPYVLSEFSNLEFYATPLTSTGCTLTITAGSVITTTCGFYTPGLDEGNNSYTLQFGKDDSEIIWASWMPFSGSPFDDLTEGVHITSASLTFVATADIASTPSKTCYVTTGLEDTAYNTSPGRPISYSEINGKLIASPLNTALLDSWITGDEYSIDITDSVKEQLGKKAIFWGSGSIAALVKNNSSAIGGYRQVASGSHIAYSAPKLTIGYVRNGYPKNSLVTTIHENEPLKNYYNYITMDIGGSTAGKNRGWGLAYFNLSSLPSGSITSASLCLLQDDENTIAGTQQLNVYPISGTLKWDYYGTTWLKRFGAGASSNWTSGSPDYYSGSMLGALGGIQSTAYQGWTWRNIPITAASSLAILNNMKNSTIPNNGFVIKDSTDTSNFGRYLSSNYPRNNLARPKLIVWINGVAYTIQYTGPSEDAGGGATPISGNAIEKVKTQWSETGGGGATVSYALAGASSTNRYLLISEGWFDNNSVYGYDAHFNTLSFNGVTASQIVTVRSNESNLTIWGVVVPNTLQPNVTYTITGTKVSSVNGGRSSVRLHIREFTHVNQTTPVYSTASNRQGANTALMCEPNGVEIQYLAKGYVADSLFLSNASTEIGVPRIVYSTQTQSEAYLRYGFSHFVPGATGGVTRFNWQWNRDWHSDPISYGSDNALGIVSLNPE